MMMENQPALVLANEELQHIVQQNLKVSENILDHFSDGSKCQWIVGESNRKHMVLHNRADLRKKT